MCTPRSLKSILFVFFTFNMVLMYSSLASANPVIPIPTQPQQPVFTPGAPTIEASSYILMDATSGKILAEKDPHKHVAPASITKLMSLYIISTAIKSGSIHLDDKVRVSTKAWKTEGSRMFVKAGDEVPVKDLLHGIIVASGNDATVALAEYIAGTEEAFTAIMNQQAKILGMNDSHFVGSTGLPDKNHYSSAYDLALLTRAYIKNFPEDYSFFAEKWFNYGGIRQPNRNRLLWRYQYADGLKTGHTSDAGYCLVSSAKKDGMRLISVLMGATSDANRTEDSMRLMTYGFRFFETHKLYKGQDVVVNARVWEGQKSELPLGVVDDFYVTIPNGQFKRITSQIELQNPMKAPIVKGQVYGTIKVMLNNDVVATEPLIALDDIKQGGFLRRAADSVRFKLHKYFSKPEDEKLNTG